MPRDGELGSPEIETAMKNMLRVCTASARARSGSGCNCIRSNMQHPSTNVYGVGYSSLAQSVPLSFLFLFVEHDRLAALGHEIWQLRSPTASAARRPGENVSKNAPHEAKIRSGAQRRRRRCYKTSIVRRPFLVERYRYIHTCTRRCARPPFCLSRSRFRRVSVLSF